jgi:hypothetical protein
MSPLPDERFDAMQHDLIGFLTGYTSMRQHQLAGMVNIPPIKYTCPEEMVLDVGKPVRSIIRECRVPKMLAGNCFANAFELTLVDPTLRYVEGWALMEQSFPTHHAWVVHPDGHISDPTWLSVIDRDLPADGKGMLPGYASRCVYIGASPTVTQHLGWFFEHETPNILAFGEMTPAEILLHGMGALERVDVDIPEMVEPIRAACLGSIRKSRPWERCMTRHDLEQGQYRREMANGDIEYWSGPFA